jgi:hypothetical protein
MRPVYLAYQTSTFPVNNPFDAVRSLTPAANLRRRTSVWLAEASAPIQTQTTLTLCFELRIPASVYRGSRDLVRLVIKYALRELSY